jgi:membrane protease YdiL (CAAX protease family)
MVLSIASGLFFEPKKAEDIDPVPRIFGKAVLSGVSVYILFGPVIAAIGMIVHLALSYITLDRGNSSWFASDCAVDQIKKSLPYLPTVLKVNVIFGIMAKLFGSDGARQIPLRMLLQSFYESPMKFLKIFFRISVVAPIIEEVIFRGFIQEKIGDIQTLVFKQDTQQTICKITRVVLQALIFAGCHFHPLLGLANVPILLGTFFFGFYMGLNKEKEKNVWAGMTIHASINTVVCLRVVLIGS